MKNINKILTILITHHNEPLEMVEPLLQSLNNQIGDIFNKIHILISNNGTPSIKISGVQKYKYVANNCDILQTANCVFASSHLNYVISTVSTPYFCFIDCDDRVCNISTINDIMNIIEKCPNIDIFRFKCFAYDIETLNTNTFMATAGMWGCIYKTESWLKNRLSIPKDMSTEYDTALIQCIQYNSTIQIKSIPDIEFICYCVRQNSSCHSIFQDDGKFLNNVKDTFLMLRHIKLYFEKMRISSDKFNEIYLLEMGKLKWRVYQYKKRRKIFNEELKAELTEIFNQFLTEL